MKIKLVILALALLGLFLTFTHSFIDFPVYYLASGSLLKGRMDLYAPSFSGGPLMNYRYPPLFLTLISPIGLLPYKAAAFIWYWVCIISIGGIFFVVSRLLGEYRSRLFIWVVSVLACGQYVVMAFHYGNAHLLVTLLFFGSCLFVIRNSRFKAALLMALAISIKVFPLISLPYFLIKKEYGFVLATGGLILLLNFLPSFYFGPGKNVELLREWVDHVVIDQEKHEVNSWINLSLKGQLRRYLTDIDYSRRAAGTENTDRNYVDVNILSLDPPLARNLWLLLSVVIFIIAHLIFYKTGTTSEDLIIEVGLLNCILLMLGPLTAKIYFVQLIWPIAVLCAISLKNGREAKVCRIAVILAALVNTALPLIPGSSTQRLFLVVGTDFYVNLIIGSASLYVIWHYMKRGQSALAHTKTIGNHLRSDHESYSQ
jgi:hypothetical protein